MKSILLVGLRRFGRHIIGTVGLSLGATPGLGTASRLILIGLMFFGRVGGLTLIYATLSKQHTCAVKYPQEKITVG